jgi:hypothetical protein
MIHNFLMIYNIKIIFSKVTGWSRAETPLPLSERELTTVRRGLFLF